MPWQRHKIILTLACAVTFSAPPALADYESCMKFCVAEHSFTHCNLQCGLAGGGRNTDGKEPAASVEHCGTSEDDKVDAVYAYLQEQHGKAIVLEAYPTDNSNVFKLDFDYMRDAIVGKGLEWVNCLGTVTFNENCDFQPEYQCDEDGHKIPVQ